MRVRVATKAYFGWFLGCFDTEMYKSVVFLWFYHQVGTNCVILKKNLIRTNKHYSSQHGTSFGVSFSSVAQIQDELKSNVYYLSLEFVQTTVPIPALARTTNDLRLERQHSA